MEKLFLPLFYLLSCGQLSDTIQAKVGKQEAAGDWRRFPRDSGEQAGPLELRVGADKNQTVQEGDTVYLECFVNNLGDWSVSWVRLKDSRIMTLDQDTFITDRRINSMVDTVKGHYAMQIRSVRGSDAGTYECQVSSSPKTSVQLHLNVVVPNVQIFGPQIIKEGSSVVLECHISNVLHHPPYVLWQHNGQGLPQTKSHLVIVGNGTVSRSVLRLDHVTSSKHTGNYSCLPASIHPTTVVIHIESEKRLPYITNTANQRSVSAALAVVAVMAICRL